MVHEHMAGQIIANASKLFILDDGLKNTISQIDSVIAENEELIRSTNQQISVVLDAWKERQAQAYEKLISAQERLARAKDATRNSEDGEVPYYYYQAVVACQDEYDEITDACSSIERIADDFASASSSFKRTIESSRQEYISVLQNSSHILTQYAELVRRSSSITSGGVGTGATGFVAAQYTGGNSSEVGQSTSRQDSGSSNQSFELSATNQTWVTGTDGSMVFNTPVETGGKLDSNQGKVNGFLGTCGLVSCVNILRLAGYPATESEVVSYASTTSAGIGRGKLCTTGSFPEDNGGTSAKTRQQILQHFGVKSELREASINNIAEAVSNGRGVIISVFAGMLYNGRSNYRDLHAITVTSVKKDRYGNVLGFYVCDSGTGGADSSKFYTSFQVENALSGRPMNVTSIIR